MKSVFFFGQIVLYCLLPVTLIEANSKPGKIVVTFPAYFQTSKDFTFNVVLFEGHDYLLPVSFKATLKDGQQIVAKQWFTQSTYGLQQHVFSDLRTAPKHIQNPLLSVHLDEYETITANPTQLADQFLFIQTDKAMYKPNQTVNMRILALDRELMPLTGELSVTVLDAKNNRIYWQNNQPLVHGLFETSFNLSNFINFGEWKISAKVVGSASETQKTFVVKKYVLPKFEVKLHFPPNNYLVYSPNGNSYTGYVRAKYTFGNHIRGSAEVSLVQSCLHDRRGLFMMKTVSLRGDGSADDGKFTLDGLNERLLGGNTTAHSCNLVFEVNVTDKITSEMVSLDSEQIQLYRHGYILKKHDTVGKLFKPGMPFYMTFQAMRPDGSSIDEQINLEVSYSFNENDDRCQDYSQNAVNVATDKFGAAMVAVQVPAHVTKVLFRARIRDVREIQVCESIYLQYSPSRKFVAVSIERPDLESKDIPKIGDTFKIHVTTAFHADFVYLIMAQNGQPFIYKKLDHRHAHTTSGRTVFIDTIVLPGEASPRCSVVAWTVEAPADEILADALEFNVEPRQQISASFEPSVVKPGGSTTITVKTNDEAGSTVAMFAVDKSAKLLRSGNDITMEDVFQKVSHGTARRHRRPSSPVLWKCWRCGWWPAAVNSANAEHVFQAVGMVIKSATHIRKQTEAGRSRPKLMAAHHNNDNAFSDWRRKDRPQHLQDSVVRDTLPISDTKTAINSIDQPVIVIREVFPETWFWWTNTSNSTELSQTIKAPDTITSWVFSAFAIGKSNGFGVLDSRKPVELIVIQPFFVDLHMPYPTVIRDEQLEIKAVVVNNQPVPEQVKLILNQSSFFDIRTPRDINFRSKQFVKTVTVGPNSSAAVPIWIRPRELGEIFVELVGVSVSNSSDAVRKRLLVEPEGEVQFANHPIFLKLESDNSPPFTTTINVNDMRGCQVVHGSDLFQFQLAGDILGPALTNLDHQIRLPKGCGEQTLVDLAPNVYIHKYLESVRQLTPEVRAKAIDLIEKGYTHELGFQLADGGFAAFNSYRSGSTWLTAFVVRSFNAASKYVGTRIDQRVLQRAWQFVIDNARDGGTFREPGSVLNRKMKGGVTSDENLAAYIYIVYVEAGGSIKLNWPSVNATVKLLAELVSRDGKKEPYQLALIAYAMSILPEDRRHSENTWNQLSNLTLREEDFIYWESSIPGQSQIETAAYALMALCNLNKMEIASRVAGWLMSQRNSLGGFVSTQDTVVGLQALAEYASQLSGIPNNMKVSAKMNFNDEEGPLHDTFSIDDSNELKLQSFDLPKDRAQDLRSVDISVSGTGVALVQLALRYNTMNTEDTSDFGVTIVSNFRRKRSTNDTRVYSFTSCLRSLSQEGASGMVTAEIGIPTGFFADLEGTKARNKISVESLLKKIETGDRKLIFYFDSLPYDSSTCVTSSFLRGSQPVRNIQRPVFKVYSYYEPSRVKSFLYSAELLE